jgi:hypothetical protein
MENAIDFYSISFIALLGISITVLICLAILKMVKYCIKTYRRNARREARRKMRVLRNEVIKKNQSISAIL